MILVGGCLKMNGYNFVHPHKFFLNPSPKVKILTTNQFPYPIAGASSVLRVDTLGEWGMHLQGIAVVGYTHSMVEIAQTYHVRVIARFPSYRYLRGQLNLLQRS